MDAGALNDMQNVKLRPEVIDDRPVSTYSLGSLPLPGATASWCRAALLAVLLCFAYANIALHLVGDWYSLADASHGFLIPFFILFLLWERRKVLAAVSVKPSWYGLLLTLPGLLLLIVGVFGADLFLSRISFTVLVAGLVWTLLGWPMLRATYFLILLMLLAIPLPALLLNQVTFPLQLLASWLSSVLLPLAGVPVLRNGNIIQLPAMELEVAEACSGIRSLVSLFTVAVIFGFLLERQSWKRLALALSSIPIAVAANALRIFGTGLCVQYWNPDKAIGFFHEFSGWLMFIVSLICLYLVHGTLRLISQRRERAI